MKNKGLKRKKQIEKMKRKKKTGGLVGLDGEKKTTAVNGCRSCIERIERTSPALSTVQAAPDTCSSRTIHSQVVIRTDDDIVNKEEI